MGPVFHFPLTLFVTPFFCVGSQLQFTGLLCVSWFLQVIFPLYPYLWKRQPSSHYCSRNYQRVTVISLNFSIPVLKEKNHLLKLSRIKFTRRGPSRIAASTEATYGIESLGNQKSWRQEKLWCKNINLDIQTHFFCPPLGIHSSFGFVSFPGHSDMVTVAGGDAEADYSLTWATGHIFCIRLCSTSWSDKF